jgi:cytosine/adenosine deaminase-related metal-dependent hydrolase
VLAHVVFAATAADIQHVVMDGRTIVEGGQHVAIADVGRELEGAIEAVRSASAAPAMTRRTS